MFHLGAGQAALKRPSSIGSHMILTSSFAVNLLVRAHGAQYLLTLHEMFSALYLACTLCTWTIRAYTKW